LPCIDMPVHSELPSNDDFRWCGGLEVHIIVAAGSSCGLLNQSHTR
jgi:hypothetical protein